MGSAKEWMSVLFLALLWGVVAPLSKIPKRRKAHITPVLDLADVLGWALMGLLIGLVTTFKWRAFHWPLILATVITFAGSGFVFSAPTNRKIQSSK
jgi:hypothetical protein